MAEFAPFDSTKLNWMEDRLILNGLSLRMEHVKRDDRKLGEDSLSFFKVKALIDQYERYWATNPGFQAEKVLELGMFGGGSLLFWFETLRPNKIVGIDYMDTGDSECFARYVTKYSLENKIKTYWGVNQADAPTLQKIVREEFGGQLDLVFDDASHMYELTRASFNILFPLIRPGGLYIIEDWAWGHWPTYDRPDHPWAQVPDLTRFVSELIQACGGAATIDAGAATAPIVSVSCHQGFVVVERGETELPQNGFDLDNYIHRRTPISKPRRVWRALKEPF